MERPPLKDTIEVWHRAVQAFDDGNVDASRDSFEVIIDTCARIMFNIGAIHYRARQIPKAILNFLMCIQRDPHMAIAHFALGLSYAQEKQHNKSRQHYEKAQSCLRGNPKIDYTQLGLKFVLWECDIVYNSALNLATMTTEPEWALEILRGSLEKAKQERQRARINEAIKSLTRNQLYEPVNLPDDVFRPPKSKVENLKDVNFLGESKVISTTSIRKKPEKSSVPKETKDGSGIPSPSREGRPKLLSSPPSPPDSVFRPIQNAGEGEKMSLRDSLTIWHEGVMAFESGDIDHALDEYLKIQDPSAKILFNIAIAQMQQNDYEGARKTCHGVINKDQHLAIGHFLLGEVHCRQGHFDDGWRSFEKALSLLRKKSSIDYSQLGLAHRLYKCEILLNQAYCYDQSRKHEWTKHLLTEAQSCKKGPNQSLVETAINSASEGKPFEYCSIPLSAVFKPPKSKIDNLAEQNFLGTSTVVSALKGSEEKSDSTTHLRAFTPPRGPSPNPPPMRAPPPVPGQASAKPNVYEDRPPAPIRTVSRGQDGRPPSPGLPSRLPPTIPISRSRSPNHKHPPNRHLPPSPRVPQNSSNEYESPISTSSTPPPSSPLGSSHGSSQGQRKGRPSKALPPPPVRLPSSSSSVASSVSSTPSSSPEVGRKLGSGPPKKALPPSPRKLSAPQSRQGSASSSQSSSPRSISPSVEPKQTISTGPPRKPLPPSPLASSPKSTSPRSLSPVKALDNNNGPRRQQPKKRTSGIAMGTYEAQADGELSIAEGDLVKVISQDGDWTVGEVSGKQGKFPSSYIQGHFTRPNNFN